MPRDGAGNYQLPAGQPVSTSTPISSTVHNALASDVATALTNSLSKDGQTTPSANLPMGGNKHTNVADGSARNQYGSIGQIQDGTLQAVSSVTGVDTITGSLAPAITGYVNNMHVVFVPAGNNTVTNPTLALNGLAAKSILKEGGVALVAGDLVSGVPALLLYSGTAWVLINPQKRTSTTVSGLGTLATQNGTLSGYGATLIDDADAATARGTLGLGTLATQSGTFSGTSSGSHSGTSSGTNTGDQTSVTGNAGTVGGYAASESATVSTVAARTSAGYLYATYLNQSSAAENSTMSHFWFETSGDGFHRKITFANAMSQINASVSIAASQIASGTLADARVAASNVTQHQASIKGKNITGKAGVSFTIQSGGTASGGSDGDIIGIY